MDVKKTLIRDAVIINENKQFRASLLIEGEFISKIFINEIPGKVLNSATIINAKGKYLIPGIIDAHVHFREPGVTNKAEIFTESKAAIAGGVTSFMDMPNTSPPAITQELLEDKYMIASEKSLANYSFYIGATNQNIDELLKINPNQVCGIKLFMGSSTGNLLVDNPDSLRQIFQKSPLLIAVHCEDEKIIRTNTARFIEKYGNNIPASYHPLIRNEEACYKSSAFAVKLAKKYNTRLHLLHLSTAREMELLSNQIPLKAKRITAEVCVHHLWFYNEDYERLGSLIKFNPAIKTRNDKEKLLEALLNDTLDTVATDHSPHTLEEKKNVYAKVPSGGPLIQHSLNIMFELFHQGKISIEKIVTKMCHHPAEIFKIHKRGYIREGYFADLVLFDPEQKWTVNAGNILYKCRWSPFEGYTFTGKVTNTFVNGNLVYEYGKFNELITGMRLKFDR